LNSLNFDLHNHSNASDGQLAAEEVVEIAHRNRCDALALTDHDTLASLPAARRAAEACGLRFIDGVEISVSWCPSGDVDRASTTIHIVGLDIDPKNATLVDGLERIRSGRIARGKQIAGLLVAAGLPDVFDEALAFAEHKEMLGRAHFARALVARGIVADVASVFKRYLTPGNPGYLPHRWASLAGAVEWIQAAGGVAVIAHPGRYDLPRFEEDALFEEFRALGGQGLEVVTGSHSPEEFAPFAMRCKEFGFFASRGADFHGPKETPIEPGQLPPLSAVDADLRPIWQLFH
jgi:3',5'-nucleoside bisphosphate phosphatase